MPPQWNRFLNDEKTAHIYCAWYSTIRNLERVDRVKEWVVKERETHTKMGSERWRKEWLIFGTRYILTVEGYWFQHYSSDGLWLKFKPKIQTTNKEGDMDNCAREASFQQPWQVMHQQNVFSILPPCLRQPLHRQSGVLWRSKRINTKN